MILVFELECRYYFSDKELDKVLKEKQVDYRSYASLLSKLFIVDVYSLNNKLASTDIGGLEFIHPDLKENFKENMSETLYKYVESNIDGKRTQELPIVKEIKVDNVFETKYTYNDTEYDAYLVNANWTYEKDLGYQTSSKLTVIKVDNILYVVASE